MKKKRVTVYMPKAQEGMDTAQPQGGGDQMQQLAQQVQQMLEQGAQPEQVVAQLLQGGVPPEAIMQVLVGLGMPQEQVQPLIEGVMQQMQGGQQQEAPPQEGMGPEAQMMAEGGEAQQQEQMMQLIQMFAQMQGVDPNEIIQQLEGASPEEQQQMMQQMVQAVQQAQGGGQQEQPMMFHGGVTTSNPGSFVSPNKADFNEVRKQMMKKYKKGGQVSELDSSSTEALVQNLQGTIANWVSKNHRMGLVNKRYDEVMQQFNPLPKAEGGMEIGKILDAYGYTQEQYDNDPKIKAEVDATSLGGNAMIGIPEVKPTGTVAGNVSAGNVNTAGETIPVGTVYGNAQWNGQQWVDMTGSMGGQGIPPYGQHYYPGWGPGMPNTGYYPNVWDKSNMGMMAGAFGAPGSAGYNMRGIGGLRGMSNPQLQQQLANVLSNPQAVGANVEYIPRFLRKDKIRITWDPITGQPTETSGQSVMPNDPRAASSISTMAEVTDEQGNITRMPIAEAERKGLKHRQIEVPVAPAGMQEYPGTGNNLATNPRTGEAEMVDERTAERWGRRNQRREDRPIFNQSAPVVQDTENPFIDDKGRLIRYVEPKERLGRTERKIAKAQQKTQEAKDKTAMANADTEYYRNKTASIKEEMMKKYGHLLDKQMHGGVTRSNPGGLIWDFRAMKFVKAPQEALFQAEMGVDLKQRRAFDAGMFTEGAMGVLGDVNRFMEAARMNPASWEATQQRSTDNTQQVYDIGSGGRGFYDQEGRFIPSDIGGKVMPGTGTDQDVYGAFTAKNFQGDFIPGQGMRYFQGGGLVGDVSFTQEELDELSALGYDISRI